MGEITEEIDKLRKNRGSNEQTNDDEHKKQESVQEKKKRKQAKEHSDKFFKIFDVARNGDLDYKEFQKGCETINLKWQSLFAQVKRQREEEKLKKEREEQEKKKAEEEKKK